MLKISEQQGDSWVDRDCQAAFAREKRASGTVRLAISLPRNAIGTFRRLAELMCEPFFVLYILHTPRGEGEPGRYQESRKSPARNSTNSWSGSSFFWLACDARHDLWVKSVSGGDMIVWDRHNSIFVYGDLGKFDRALNALGFRERERPVLGLHMHHYRQEFDNEAAAILSVFDWCRTPLRPEDEQWPTSAVSEDREEGHGKQP